MVEPFTSRDVGGSGAVPRASSPRTRCCVTFEYYGWSSRPSRAASAVAWPRVGTASLRRIAAT